MPYMYILECSDKTLYTGSTWDLERRLGEHQSGEGSVHTNYRLPVRLLYFEIFTRIDLAFYREKQVQNWSQKKKRALASKSFDELSRLAKRRTVRRGPKRPR